MRCAAPLGTAAAQRIRMCRSERMPGRASAKLILQYAYAAKPLNNGDHRARKRSFKNDRDT